MDESIYALNAECDAMQDEIARLEAENVELREQLKYERQTSRSRLESIDLLKVENAKLRELLAKARDPQRIGGQADPSSFAYAIEQLREFRWQHATNDEEAIPYINNVVAAHERENAKLRELLQRTWDAFHDATAREFVRVKNELRELGIEVD